MIRLKNVSKYYYSKGLIASGISKVNLELNKGEFVIITGESGSGKTTLLNVISGLDSYEDGEMFVNGEETSHYLASDFEEYRKKYIGNIFQNYNLVNSYTVYQNVELILLINGYKKEEIKKRITDILEKVDLTAFAKTKVSKLSGGQKQRVSIARALAKDTDIIVADEPTGNLDSESAEGIAKLLSDISRDKLVIVVTHNYPQFEKYATRRIEMHDGKVVKDEVLCTSQPPAGEEAALASAKAASHTDKIRFGSKLKLGLRNTFNVGYKFILLLIVFLFLVFAVTSQYTTFLNQRTEAAELGFNNFFYNYSDDRIIVKKGDNSEFTQDDYTAIKNISTVKSITPTDIVLDNSLYIENEDFSYEAYPRSINEFQGIVDIGRLPEKDNEILLSGQKDEYSLSEETANSILNKTFKIYVGESTQIKIKVVGIAFDKETDEYSWAGDAYMQESALDEMLTAIYNYHSTATTMINGKAMDASAYDTYYGIFPSSKVSKGNAVMTEETNNFFKSGKAVGNNITVTVKNIYYKESIKLKISDVYTEKNCKAKTGYSYDEYGGATFVNKEDYKRLFSKGNYQCSVYSSNVKTVDDTVADLKRMGYTTLPLKDSVIGIDQDIFDIIQVPLTILLLIALLFIAYFVVRLILKSRTAYFSILRMLGLAKKNIRRILDIELFTVVNIAFAIFLAVVVLVNREIINVEYLHSLIEFMKPRDYAILYVIVQFMAFLISGRFSRKLFKKTAMGTFREGDE